MKKVSPQNKPLKTLETPDSKNSSQHFSSIQLNPTKNSILKSQLKPINANAGLLSQEHAASITPTANGLTAIRKLSANHSQYDQTVLLSRKNDRNDEEYAMDDDKAMEPGMSDKINHLLPI